MLNLCSGSICYPIHKSCFADIYFRPKCWNTKYYRKNWPRCASAKSLLSITEEIFATRLSYALTLFYLDWLFICIVSPSDAGIKWIEVMNGIRIYGNEVSLKEKRKKFFVDINCVERGKRDALFLYKCHTLLLVTSVV